MRRSLWFRGLSVLLGIWLPLFVGEPNLLSPCPMHGAFAVSHAASGSAHHHGHAGVAAAHRAPGSDQSAPEHPEHNEKDCSCIGCCAPGVVHVVVPDAPVAVIAVATYEPQPEFPAADTHPQPVPELSRPYPTGPPRA